MRMKWLSAVVLGFALVAPGTMASGKAAAEGEGGAVGEVTSTVPVTPTVSLPRNERAFSPAEAEILQELEDRRIDMDRREQALELREKLADMLEARLAERTSQLETLKGQIEKMIGSLSGKDDKELQQLSQMYAAMKPDVAAGVLDRLDNAIVHDVLMRMPVKKSGKILEALDPAKARVVSEMIAQRSLLPAMARTNAAGGTAPAVPPR